jgi:cytoskeletal protein RodZ
MDITETLQQAREKKSLSMEDVSRLTKISLRILEAMEAGAFEKLPGKLYTRSFLKQYADFLGIDSDWILQQYQQYIQKEKPHLRLAQPSRMQEARREKSYRYWLGFGAMAVGFIVLIAIWQGFTQWYQKVQELKKTATGPLPRALVPQQTIPLIPKEALLEVVVRALEPTWMQVRVDETIVFQNVLSENSYEVWHPKQNAEMWVSNAGGVEILLNKKLLGSPGKKGQVMKGIILSREGMRIP